jgi:hypothetical protein
VCTDADGAGTRIPLSFVDVYTPVELVATAMRAE